MINVSIKRRRRRMESEMKDLNPRPPNQQPDPTTIIATRDDRPLLKSLSTGSISSTTSSSVSFNNLGDIERKFAAFVRRDNYGSLGRGDLPTREKVLLGLALVTLVPVRVVVAIAILVLYYLICRVCTMFSRNNNRVVVVDESLVVEEEEDFAHLVGWRRIVIVQCGRALSRLMLFVLGFYWITKSYKVPHHAIDKGSASEENKRQPEEMGRPGVIISNHVSYLDILYHMSCSFPSFVAKRSVANLPLVGLISKCLGCVYVQRESKASDFKGVSAIVTERIKEAHRNESAPIMMLFPEGTTTNGDFLLPFKTGGFLASAPVLPVLLSYEYRRFSPAWDSISGVRHVIFLLCQFVNYMEVTQLPTYYPSQQEKDDPKLYANNVRRLMASEGSLVPSDMGLAEKRIYQSALNGLFSQC